MVLSLNPTDKVILALDGMDSYEALAILSRLPDVIWVKVGVELFVSSGPGIVRELRDRGLRVFLDLKFHDIPASMAGACKRAAKLGAELITIHSCAGTKALIQAQAAALEGAEEAGLPPPKLLAVTVLTSWDEGLIAKELLIRQTIQERVDMLASLSKKAGLAGCVCSPKELRSLRQRFPEPFHLVTPGIRPKASELGDQVRVMTPSEAIKAGASRIVIGRPITRADDPRLEFEKCCQSLKI